MNNAVGNKYCRLSLLISVFLITSGNYVGHFVFSPSRWRCWRTRCRKTYNILAGWITRCSWLIVPYVFPPHNCKPLLSFCVQTILACARVCVGSVQTHGFYSILITLSGWVYPFCFVEACCWFTLLFIIHNITCVVVKKLRNQHYLKNYLPIISGSFLFFYNRFFYSVFPLHFYSPSSATEHRERRSTFFYLSCPITQLCPFKFAFKCV